jgi:hypothetical protein
LPLDETSAKNFLSSPELFRFFSSNFSDEKWHILGKKSVKEVEHKFKQFIMLVMNLWDNVANKERKT